MKRADVLFMLLGSSIVLAGAGIVPSLAAVPPDLSITVVDEEAKPVPDAVVTVDIPRQSVTDKPQPRKPDRVVRKRKPDRVVRKRTRKDGTVRVALPQDADCTRQIRVVIMAKGKSHVRYVRNWCDMSENVLMLPGKGRNFVPRTNLVLMPEDLKGDEEIHDHP